MRITKWQMRKTIKKARTKLKPSYGTFHSVKNSGLNFWKFPLTNGRAFLEFRNTRTTLRGVSKFLKISHWECRPKFDFPSGTFG